MSVRGLWILPLNRKEQGSFLFSRNWNSVEKRAELVEGKRYIPIPTQLVLYEAVCKELGLTSGQVKTGLVQFKQDEKPVFAVQVETGTLWPLLAIEQNGLLFCCLPLVEQGAHTRPAFIDIPGLYAGLNLLTSVTDFFAKMQATMKENALLMELTSYITNLCPFGSPTGIMPSMLQSTISRINLGPASSLQQPVWRTSSHKAKSHIQFVVKESIKAMQYDSPSQPDFWEVYGTVTCNADIEGPRPEVTIIQESFSAFSTKFLMHHCVLSNRSIESKELHKSQEEIKFVPPNHTFTLCHYTTSKNVPLPIRGSYQIKGDDQVDILVQLYLEENVKTSFEYCELQLPMYHRGPVQHHVSSPSHGTVMLSPDKAILVWNIGNKWPARNNEVLLRATLHFGSVKTPEMDHLQISPQDKSAYGQLFFKTSDFTLTGLSIDTKGIHLSSGTKSKSSLVRNLSSVEYKIWATCPR